MTYAPGHILVCSVLTLHLTWMYTQCMQSLIHLSIFVYTICTQHL